MLENQPKKYCATLRKTCENLFDSGDIFLLVILCPNDRRSEVETALQLQDLNDWILIDWESFLDKAVSPVVSDGTLENRVVASFLDEYLRFHLGNRMVDIAKARLVGPSVSIGNTYHWDLLYKLRDLFPNASKIGTGNKHVGFYFYLGEEEPEKWNWFGFTKERPEEVRLAVETHLPNFDPSSLSQLTKIQGERGNTLCTLDFSEEINSMEAWKTLISPVLDSIRTQEN